MDRTFQFTLEKKEYVEYLSYQIGSSKTMRGYRWFLLTGVPAVLLTGIFLLHIRMWTMVACILALAVLWVLYGAKAVWKRYIRRRIERQILPKMNIKEFREMSYHFGGTDIEYQENGKTTRLPYRELMMLPLENELAFCHKEGTVLIPYRLFEGDDDLRGFLKEYELARKG